MPGLVNGGFLATTTATTVKERQKTIGFSVSETTRSTLVVHFVAVIGRPRREIS